MRTFYSRLGGAALLARPVCSLLTGLLLALLPLLTLAQAPTISSLSPGRGAMGSSFILTGTNLGGTTSVRLGEQPAAFTVISPTELRVTVPRGASTQRVQVTTPGGPALSGAAFGVDKVNSYGFPAAVASNFSNVYVVRYSTPAFTDLDGNGRLDLLVGNDAGHLHHYEQDAVNSLGFTLVTASFNGIDVGGVSTPTFTDLDGDGLLDMLVGEGSGNLNHYKQVAANSRDFTLVTETFSGIAVDEYAAPTFTDFDADGLLDLVVGQGNGTMHHYEQDAANSLNFTLVTAAFSGIGGFFFMTPTFTDLDGDGLLDMLLGETFGRLRHYEQSAPNSSSFTLLTNFFNSIDVVSLARPALTDLDGDGRLDLLVGRRNGSLDYHEQAPAPVLSSLSPTSGSVGTVVTLTGTDFTGATAVSFNGTAATTFSVTNSTTATATVPVGASTGNVTITTSAGTSNGLAFTVPAPVITAFSVGSGAAGTSVTLTGTDLSGATAVTVNGVAVAPANVTSTTLDFVVPAGASATQRMTVTSPAGTSPASTAFTVQLHVLTTAPTDPLPTANAAPVANSAVAVGFTEAVSSATAATLAVFGGIGGGKKAGTVSGGGTSTLRFAATASTAVSNFQPGEVVSVSVPNTVLGAGGLPATPFVYQFTAGGLHSSAGTFTNRLDLPLSARHPRHVRWADLDGDGKPDLLAANLTTSEFSVNRNLTTAVGTPSFGAASFFSISPGASYEPYSAAAGDADGDGRPDVATANRRQGSVSVCRNTSTSGSISFDAFVEWNVGGPPQEVQWADLDGDGKLDLVTVNNLTNNVSVLRNTSSGVGNISFDAALSFALSISGVGSDNLRVADLDGDGKLDLVMNNASNTFMRVMRNNSTRGTMSFVVQANVPVQGGSTPYGPALADVDGDGRPDILAVGTNQPNAYVARNTSTPGSISFAGYVSFAVGARSGYLTAADLNGDGRPDMALGATDGTLRVLLNTSSGAGSVSFGTASTYALTPGGSATGLMAADADGDGTLDVAVSNAGTNSLSVLMNTPNAATLTGFTPPSGPVGTPVDLTGTNLTGATAVTFSGSSGHVVATGFTVVSSTSITGVVVPAGAITGTVTVTTPIGTNLVASPVFTVTPMLSNLVLSAGSLSPAFAGTTTAYTLSTTSASTTVTPTNAQTAGGTITVNGTAVASGAASGAIALLPGANTLTVVVNPAGVGTVLTYTVTVTRTCALTALARNVSLPLDASGNATLAATDVNNGSNSTCGAVSLALSPTAFTCANVGTPVAVTLTVTDSFGGSTTASATVTVLDTTAPVFTPKGTGTSVDPFTNLNALPGVATGTYWFRLGGNTFQGYVDGTTDGGGWVEILNYVHQGGTNPALNARTTSLPVQTSAGLGTDESAITAAWGHAAPALVAALNPLEVRFYGQTSAHGRILHFKTSHTGTIAYLKTGTGIMGGISNSYTLLAGHTANLPATTTNYFLNQGSEALTNFPFYAASAAHWAIRGQGSRWEMDDFPNSFANSTVHRVFVRGSATALPGDQTVVAEAGQCGATVTLAGTQPVTDNCTAPVTVTFSPASGTFFAVGTTPVTATATDASGNTSTSSFTVTVQDTQVPVFAVSSTCGTGSSGSPFTSLNCLTGTATGTYWFRLGGTTFQGYVDGTTDGGGWVEILNYVHQGGTNPALNARTTSLPVQTSAALGTDESAVTAAWGHAAPALVAALHPLEVRFYGQTSAHGRVIHFKTSHAGTLSYLKTGTGTMTGISNSYTLLTGHTANLPVTTDNNYINQGNLALTNFPFYANATAHWGIQGLGGRWEVDDYPNSFANSTIHRVFVRGSGTASPGNPVAATTAAGQCGTTVDLTGTQPATDNCASPAISFSPASGTFFAVGSTPVTVTATDAAGNTSTSTFTVTVTDTQAPTAFARNVTVALDVNGSATLVPAQVNNGSADNCTAPASLTLAVAPSTFTCANVGNNAVTLTVTDASGNQHTATATVTVTAPPLTSTTWAGSASTAWTDCANWSYGLLPSATVSALLPVGMPRYPSLPAGTYPVMDLTIASGASLTTAGPATLLVSGNFANHGTATLAGLVEFTGPAATQAVGGTTATTFATLTVNKTAGSVELGRDLTVSEALTFPAGPLNLGTLRTTASHRVLLGSAATLAETETAYVLGQVAATRTLAAGTAEPFGGLGLTLTPAAGSVAPGLTPVVRTTGTALTSVGSSLSVLRSFDIQPAVNTGLDVVLTFAYFDHELNGIAEANLALFKSVSGPAGPWVSQRPALLSAGTNTVSKAGISSFSVWTLGNANAPLPVELLAFTAEQQGESAVKLAWRTASEVNSQRFDAERSLDGRAFRRLGSVAGQGTTASPTAYAWLDEKLPAGGATLYYRLKQVDTDGLSTYSPVRVVQVAPPLGASLTLYPNPARTALTVAQAEAGTLVRVFDALGRVVAQAPATATGTARLTLPAGLAAGVYVVRSGTQAQRLTVE